MPLLSLLLFLEILDFGCQTHVYELTSNSSLTSGLAIYDFGNQNYDMRICHVFHQNENMTQLYYFFLWREWDMINLICRMNLSVVKSIVLFSPIVQLRQFWELFLAPLWNEWVDKYSQKKKEKKEGIYDQKL